jgi:hypothetical protein
VFSSVVSSDENLVAAFILILWRGTIPGRNATMGYPRPWCSRNGKPFAFHPSLQIAPRFRSLYFDPTIGGRI